MIIKDHYRIINGQKVRIMVDDDAYAGKSEEELEAVRENARNVARGIMARAEARAAKEKELKDAEQA